ncbi:hypothetical protein BGZ98_010145 [Dissophora globulifera]|nr:hypothetical protein BGZ98_010145 [Dissophora globulifera]
MGGNDRWISWLACTLIAFISISSQVFIFWPWLLGSWSATTGSAPAYSPHSDSRLEPHSSDAGYMDQSLEDDGATLGYLSIMWTNLNVQALLYLIPFNCSLFMLCWNYYLTMMTDPGSPPHDWMKCPYHQGILTNFQVVLGQNPLLWLWPQPMLGDGIHFKVRREKPSELLDQMSSDDEYSSSSSRAMRIKQWLRPLDPTTNYHHVGRDTAIGTGMVVIARHLEGTAYFLYGPPMPSQDQSIPSRHSPTRDGCPQHHSHHVDRESPVAASFWGVFRPSVDTQINDKPTASEAPAIEDQMDSQSPPQLFFLSGDPLPLGSYPLDMAKPHACIPPHLYYRVTVSGPTYDGSSSSSISSSTSTSTSSLQEYVLPFVHRLGDGKDEAGGLTSAYHLLEEFEDADDAGEFLQRRLVELQQQQNAGIKRASPLFSQQLVAAAIYACTEVLVSEKRTLPLVEQEFFLTPRLSTELPNLRRHIMDTIRLTDLDTHPLPFHLVKSDVKLLLPNMTAY